MKTAEGKLKIGLEFEGKNHVDFSIRAPKVKDSLEAIDEVGESSGLKFMLATYARQILVLGDIPKEKITTELLLELYDIDLAIIQKVSEEYEKKLMSVNQN